MRQLSRVWGLLVLFALFDFTFGALSLSIPVAFLPLKDYAISATAAFFSGGFLIFTVLMPFCGSIADRYRPLPMLIGTLVVIAVLFGVAGMSESPYVIAALLWTEYVAAAAAYSLALSLIGKNAPDLLPLIGIAQSLAMAAGSLVAGLLIGSDEASRVFILLGLVYLVTIGPVLLAPQ